MLNEAQYLEQRIDDQIAWYGSKSRRNKACYRTLRIISIIIALSIPILTGFIGKAHDELLKVVISIAGALVALLEGLLSLYKFQENWIQYRATAESLKHHRFLFMTSAAPYHESGAFSLFVQQAEALMANERMSWVQGNQPAASHKQDDAAPPEEG